MLQINPLILTLSLSTPLVYEPPPNKLAEQIPYPAVEKVKLPSTLDYQPPPSFDPSDLLYKTIIRELEEEQGN